LSERFDFGRSQSTFNNYSRHVAAISLYFGKIPTELDAEKFRTTCFTTKKVKTLRKRILNTAFTDFGFAKI
jgi:hypothetical protein